jgi:NACHT domain
MNTKRRSSDGRILEQHTARLLRLYPGATVAQDIELAGKKVDILLKTSAPLVPHYTVAVECKDWTRPLTREQCAAVLADYNPLLEQRLVDQFLLVTRHGVVANAKKLFNERRCQHLRFDELADQLFNPHPLIANLKRQYEESPLNFIYVEQHAYSPDLAFTAKHYEAIYNDFVDFAISNRTLDLETALKAWVRYGGESADDFARTYAKVDFVKCIDQRRYRESQGLVNIVDKWIESEPSYPLALLGSYGTGKSSFARRISYILAERYISDPTSRIPFLIELKEFGSHQDIRGLVTHELVNRHGVSNGSFELFQSLNAAGRFVIVLDGFDEMKQGMTADSLLYNFNQLSQLSVGRSRVLLCGRPTLFESDTEQQKVLTGKLAGGTVNAQYIQVEIAPFTVPESRQFLEMTAVISNETARNHILAFVKEIRRFEASSGSLSHSQAAELRSILTRPVHLPMLASVVPRRRIKLRSLHRAYLYSEFIDAIIEREMLKRRAEFTMTYDAQVRRKFARSISLEMARQGESSSIRYSDIPHVLLEPFRTSQRPLDAVRRDLVSACFLDRKGSDILYFPHKSFWEYLVSEEIVTRIRDLDHPATDTLGFKITDEMFAFLNELLTASDWLKLAQNCERNARILTTWVRKKAETKVAISHTFLEYLAVSASSIDVKFQQQVAYYIESYEPNHPAGLNAARELGMALLASNDDVTAVHAYRALARLGGPPDCQAVLSVLGSARALTWYQYRWLQSAEKYEKELRQYLLQLFVRTLVSAAALKTVDF